MNGEPCFSCFAWKWAQTGLGEFRALLWVGDHPASERAPHHLLFLVHGEAGTALPAVSSSCSFLLRLPHFTLPRLSAQWGSRLPLTAQALECPDTSLCIGDAPGSVLRGRRPSLQPGQDTIPQLPLIESSKDWGEHQRLKSTRNFPAAHPA